MLSVCVCTVYPFRSTLERFEFFFKINEWHIYNGYACLNITLHFKLQYLLQWAFHSDIGESSTAAQKQELRFSRFLSPSSRLRFFSAFQPVGKIDVFLRYSKIEKKIALLQNGNIIWITFNNIFIFNIVYATEWSLRSKSCKKVPSSQSWRCESLSMW